MRHWFHLTHRMPHWGFFILVVAGQVGLTGCGSRRVVVGWAVWRVSCSCRGRTWRARGRVVARRGCRGGLSRVRQGLRGGKPRWGAERVGGKAAFAWFLAG